MTALDHAITSLKPDTLERSALRMRSMKAAILSLSRFSIPGRRARRIAFSRAASG